MDIGYAQKWRKIKSAISPDDYPHNTQTEPDGINNLVVLVSQSYDLSIKIRFPIASSM